MKRGAAGLAACVALAFAGACQSKADAAPGVAPVADGDVAPAFSTRGDDGKAYALADLKGRYVILYFYPRDDTTGCTIEAKGFRDDFEKYVQKGAVVLGVSLDTVDSHKAFREKYQLNFPLLVGGAEIASAYSVPVVGGWAARQTFVIGKDGHILKAFRSVNPTGHSAEILALLK